MMQTAGISGDVARPLSPLRRLACPVLPHWDRPPAGVFGRRRRETTHEESARRLASSHHDGPSTSAALKPHRIDVHHHIIPPGYLSEMGAEMGQPAQRPAAAARAARLDAARVDRGDGPQRRGNRHHLGVRSRACGRGRRQAAAASRATATNMPRRSRAIFPAVSACSRRWRSPISTAACARSNMRSTCSRPTASS